MALARSCWLSSTVGFLVCVLFPLQEISGASAGTLSGQITHAVTGAGMERVKVIASSAEGIFEVLTDSEGNYSIPRLPAGTYLVTARADGFLSSFQAQVRVSEDAQARVDLVLTPTAGSAVIQGRVTNQNTGLGIKGARVTVSGPRGTIEVTTDEKGSYLVSDLPPGVYVILAKADNFFSDSIGSFILMDGVKTPVDISLMPIPGSGDPGALTGQVVDAQTGKGIPKAQITLSGLGGFFQTETDETGNYFLSNLPSGSYFILVKADGFRQVSERNITLYANATTLRNFFLQSE